MNGWKILQRWFADEWYRDRNFNFALQNIPMCVCDDICLCVYVPWAAIRFSIFRIWWFYATSQASNYYSLCNFWKWTLFSVIFTTFSLLFAIGTINCNKKKIVFVLVCSKCRPRLQPIKTIGRMLQKENCVLECGSRLAVYMCVNCSNLASRRINENISTAVASQIDSNRGYDNPSEINYFLCLRRWGCIAQQMEFSRIARRHGIFFSRRFEINTTNSHRFVRYCPMNAPAHGERYPHDRLSKWWCIWFACAQHIDMAPSHIRTNVKIHHVRTVHTNWFVLVS